ncbi:MAG: mercury resistance protein [Woeseiaceae bacterium]|jgi:mercuric ion transport protein|nr:mercury resistance protein [Woeseiaceae bacterium]
MIRHESCSTCADDDSRKGYFYAVMTAVLCPCHLPILGLYLGTGAAGAFFAEYFIIVAITLAILTLLSLTAAIRILL